VSLPADTHVIDEGVDRRIDGGDYFCSGGISVLGFDEIGHFLIEGDALHRLAGEFDLLEDELGIRLGVVGLGRADTDRSRVLLKPSSDGSWKTFSTSFMACCRADQRFNWSFPWRYWAVRSRSRTWRTDEIQTPVPNRPAVVTIGSVAERFTR
jgi:hypothetical protein